MWSECRIEDPTEPKDCITKEKMPVLNTSKTTRPRIQVNIEIPPNFRDRLIVHHLYNVNGIYHTEEDAVSKKKKTACAFAEDFQAIIALIPKLESFIKIHKEIAAGYQKYRKNGGAAISEIEKHVGINELKGTPVITSKKLKASKDGSLTLKTKKKTAV
jgi:hypothetical protein